MNMFLAVIEDGVFAAMAGIGFGMISNPPRIAMKYCGLIAAIGHMTRYVLTTLLSINIIVGSLIGAVTVGILAIIIAPRVKCPPETFSYPALLPMIPGIYAYKAIQAFFMALTADGEDLFNHYFYLCESNGMICSFIIIGMVLGQLIPTYLFKRIAYSSTKA